MIRALPTWRHIAGVAILSLVAVTVPGVALTNASWNDTEFVAGTTETLRCAGNTDLTSRSAARFLTGTLGSGPTSNLDTLAGVTGITVTNNGTTQSAVAGTPGAAVAGTGFAAPLSATLINGALQAGTSVVLPLNWPTGAYQQWGEARDTGWSYSAAGAVSNSGAIVSPGPSYPTLSPSVGSLSLSSLPGIGSTLGTLTDVALTVGAISSVAALDGCSYAWTGGTPTSAELNRDYSISSLTADLTSPALAQLFNTAGTVTGLVTADVDGEFGDAATSGEAELAIAATGLGALGTAVGGVLTTGVLGTTLSTAGISLAVNGSSPSQVSSTVISVNLSPVTTLLSSTIDDGIVSVNLATGHVGVDIGLLSGGLNSRPANTELLTDTQVLDIAARVNTLLTNQIAAIRTALTTALDAATVTVNLTVALRAATIDVLGVSVGFTGNLKSFVDGTAASHSGVVVTGPQVVLLGSGAVQSTLNFLSIPSLLASALGTVASTTTAVLDAAQAQAYDELLGPQLTSVLSAATGQLTTAMWLLRPLLITIGTLLSITVNVQPDQAPTSLPANGVFSVSALRLTAINGATSLLNLSFATASVGANAT
jgi:hypothetical protein